MKKKPTIRRRLEDIPTFAEVAALIVSSDRPLWLPAHLGWWSDGVRYDRMLDEVRPTKAETRTELQHLAETLRSVARKIDSPFIRHFLEDEKHSKKLPVSTWQLNDLAECADLASGSTLLVDEQGKGKRGRGKPKLPNHADAKSRLAARVVEIWIHFNGKEPGLKNQRLKQIAQAYWLACGGSSDGPGDPCNGWSKYFKLVRDQIDCRDLKQLRQLWRIDLAQAQRRGSPPRYAGTYFPAQTSEFKTPVQAR